MKYSRKKNWFDNLRKTSFIFLFTFGGNDVEAFPVCCLWIISSKAVNESVDDECEDLIDELSFSFEDFVNKSKLAGIDDDSKILFKLIRFKLFNDKCSFGVK